MNVPNKTFIRMLPDASPTTSIVQLSGAVPNAQSVTVTIPDKVTIQDATINNLQVKSQDGTTIATNVGSILKQLRDDMQTVAQKNGNFSPTVNNADIS